MEAVLCSDLRQSTVSPVLTLTKLDQTSLKKFFNNHVCAIRVPKYADEALCNTLANWFTNSDRKEDYYHEVREGEVVKYLEYGVERVGVAYNTTYGKPKGSPEWNRYCAEALSGIQSLRTACHPFLSPIDKFRLELDENWPQGANVANFEGQKMFVGIGRVMEASTSNLAELQPHFDSVPNNLKHLKGQFSANIYLQLPPSGGELELWNITPLPISEIDSADVDVDWRSNLPKSFTIKPEIGDLILINTRRAHAIRSFKQGKRVTVQCFIGLNVDDSLSLWN